MRDHYDVPVWVDRDVNLMALGEWHKGSPRSQRDLMYLQVDEEVGAAVVSRGSLFRGDAGAAGHIGHSQVTDDPKVVCRCGRTGCLEAVVSGWSLVERLSARVDESPFLATRMQANGHITAQDVGDAARADDPIAINEIAAAIRVMGMAAATYVNFANPGTLVIGGGMRRVGAWTVDLLEAELKSRLTAAAGADLTVRAASLNFLEGLVGGAILAVEQLFGPSAVGLWIDNGTPVGRAAALQRALVV
jgi:predicted NBD/HSP70 family sugar kinase